jgi:pimeloyl-ACP methyl ester carboxylesterase
VSSAIIFIHGLWMNGKDMYLLRYRFKKIGYKTFQFKYNSTKQTPVENAHLLSEYIDSVKHEKINFVCHSLGGIVLRHYLSLYSTNNIGNIIMLGTPNKTSAVARKIINLPLGKKLLGKSVENGLTGILPKWNNNEKLGIIAGRVPFASGMFFSIIKSPNDGTVSVEETRLDGASDHITLYLPHLGLLFSKKAFLQAKHFLEHSSFIHS